MDLLHFSVCSSLEEAIWLVATRNKTSQSKGKEEDERTHNPAFVQGTRKQQNLNTMAWYGIMP